MEKKFGIHFIGGWVGPTTSLKGYGKEIRYPFYRRLGGPHH